MPGRLAVHSGPRRDRHRRPAADGPHLPYLPAARPLRRLRTRGEAERGHVGGPVLGTERENNDMNQPTSIAIVPCHTCSPWVRWFRTASGAWARQEQHEPHCETFPHVRRSVVE